MATRFNNESEYNKAIREMRKKEHLCIQCGQQDAYTLNGRSRCAICAEAGRVYDKRRDPAKRKASQKAKVARWIAAGKCAKCGRDKEPGYSLCKRCIARTTAQHRTKKIEQGMNWPRGSNGMCWTCNHKPALPGKKICADCYANCMEALKRANEANQVYGHGPFEEAINDFWKLWKAKREMVNT